MAEFDLQRMLEGMDEKLTDARDRVIKLEGRFDSMEAHRMDVERRLGSVESAVDAIQDEKASEEAVKAYRAELLTTRRWVYGIGAGFLMTLAGAAAGLIFQ